MGNRSHRSTSICRVHTSGMAGAPSLKIVALSASVSVSLPPLLSSPFSLSAGPQMIRKSRGIVLARSAAQRRSEYQMCEGIWGFSCLNWFSRSSGSLRVCWRCWCCARSVSTLEQLVERRAWVFCVHASASTRPQYVSHYTGSSRTTVRGPYLGPYLPYC